MKISVYIATSLDGFIAREDRDIEWLNNSGYGEVDKGEDFGYEAFMSTVDALVMGRKTYEKVLSFGGDWPYGKNPVFVLSTSGVKIPDAISETVSSLSGSTQKIVKQLEKLGYQHIYLDGGLTIQKFLEAGLVDEITITKIPVFIGKGIPLFGPLSKDIKLKHVQTEAFNNGFVQSRYEIFK
ncbi:MAG: dihydrofolate reductase family protein [Gracilimonas sp.]|uniref:dihydrofolate reductase family protein n=1 Tax=Gracilimonas sp. TaxID=1974203 RepID=UPI003751DA98|nr:dihydrofolate reductase family protein [Gracilimonas sp.]